MIITRLWYRLHLKLPDFPDVSADVSLGNFLEDLSEHFDVFLAFGEFVATIRLRSFVWYCLYFGEIYSLCCPEMQFFTEQWKLQGFFCHPVL